MHLRGLMVEKREIEPSFLVFSMSLLSSSIQLLYVFFACLKVT